MDESRCLSWEKKDNCPNNEFVPHNLNNYHVCRAKGTVVYCASLQLESHGVKYSQVCGTAKGYQAGSTHAFKSGVDINSPYLSGVSITHGSPKRSHVFSLAAGLIDRIAAEFTCPCNGGTTHKPPAFVGDDYYCESGATNIPKPKVILDDDPLWDGEKFLNNEEHCDRAAMPLFKSSISPATSDQLELRLCRNKQETDVYLESFDIYIH